ncbi:hypothetical protein [Acaryochloris marina]|uniref:Uncharacterized protein n=1 Tax=Acaryochloris marina (strain MBIC 11017) TaxID=329726 RepID=B0C8U0_ACAM1|nr:hypothetical protein [Acaryochloris marina]ABW25330.1 hypothetical protein AM1_0244 [Acaryochloris marina MBIC11017]
MAGRKKKNQLARSSKKSTSTRKERINALSKHAVDGMPPDDIAERRINEESQIKFNHLKKKYKEIFDALSDLNTYGEVILPRGLSVQKQRIFRLEVTQLEDLCALAQYSWTLIVTRKDSPLKTLEGIIDRKIDNPGDFIRTILTLEAAFDLWMCSPEFVGEALKGKSQTSLASYRANERGKLKKLISHQLTGGSVELSDKLLALATKHLASDEERLSNLRHGSRLWLLNWLGKLPKSIQHQYTLDNLLERYYRTKQRLDSEIANACNPRHGRTKKKLGRLAS